MRAKYLQQLTLTGAIVLTTQFAGCSLFTSKNAVDEMVDNHQYDAAIAEIDKLPAEDQAAFDLAALEKARQQYINTHVTALKGFTQKRAFADAHRIANELQRNVPESQKAKEAIQQLTQKESDYLIYYQHLYNQQLARFYISERPLLNKLASVEGNNQTNKSLAQAREYQRGRLAETLGNYGLEALKKGQRITAKTNLTLAQSLHSDKRWQAGLAKIDAHAQKIRDQKLADALAEKKLAWQGEQKTYQQLINRRDWLGARRQLNGMKSLAPAPDDQLWLSERHDELDIIIQKQVKFAYDKGVALYSQGFIDEAITTWESVVKLAPDDKELRDSLNRAKSFQRTYRNLKPEKPVEL